MEAAEKAFRAALAGDLAPAQRIEALLYLARIELQKGQYDKADAHASEAANLLKTAGGDSFQGMLVALSIRYEAARGAGDEEKALGIQKLAARLSAEQEGKAWDKDEVPGALVHKASGAVLPEEVAGLAEVQLFTYDPQGLDGSVSYAPEEPASIGHQDAAAQVIVDILMNKGQSLDEHFAQAEQDIEQNYADAQQITASPIAVVKDDRRLEGKMAVYSIRGGDGKGFATVHVFRLSPDTLLRFRAFYSQSEAGVMRSRVAALMQTMVWPEGRTVQ